MYGHCSACGHGYRREVNGFTGDTLLLPNCECAGDPPVDRTSMEYLVYLGYVHTLHYMPNREGVPK